MLMLSASSFVIGVLLARKFRVFVLVPMILLGSAVILVAGVLYPVAETFGEIVSYAISLQFGYLVGAGTHHVLIGDHAARAHRASLVPPTR
jgi:hypothetical protein